MNFSDIPLWIYILLAWYAPGIWAVGALFAGIVREGNPLPTKGRYWIFVIALLGPPLLIYVWLGCKDLGKGFVITDRGAQKLRKKIAARSRP